MLILCTRIFYQPEFRQYYNATLMFGYERRKNFCIKTLLFLQKQIMCVAIKAPLTKTTSTSISKSLEDEGSLNGTPYKMEDSIHNHVRFWSSTSCTVKGVPSWAKEKQ